MKYLLKILILFSLAACTSSRISHQSDELSWQQEKWGSKNLVLKQGDKVLATFKPAHYRNREHAEYTSEKLMLEFRKENNKQTLVYTTGNYEKIAVIDNPQRSKSRITFLKSKQSFEMESKFSQLTVKENQQTVLTANYPSFWGKSTTVSPSDQELLIAITAFKLDVIRKKEEQTLFLVNQQIYRQQFNNK